MDQVTKSLSRAEIDRIEAQRASGGTTPNAAGAQPEFVRGDEGRVEVVPLDFPVTVGGVKQTTVTIRRPVMREWRAYLRACADAVQKGGPGAEDLVDQPWLSIPAIVLEGLDFADGARVEAAMEGFFGRSTSAGGTEESSPSESTTGDASP